MKNIITIIVMLICLVGCYSYREVKLTPGKRVPNRLQSTQDTLYYVGSDDQYHYFYYYYNWWIDCFEWQIAKTQKSKIVLDFEFELKESPPKIQQADPVWVRCNLDVQGCPVKIIKDEKDRVLNFEQAPQLKWNSPAWNDIQIYPTNQMFNLNQLGPNNYSTQPSELILHP